MAGVKVKGTEVLIWGFMTHFDGGEGEDQLALLYACGVSMGDVAAGAMMNRPAEDDWLGCNWTP